MKTAEYIPGIMVGVYFLSLILVYKRLSLVSLLISTGVGAITHSVTGSLIYASAAALFTLFAMVALVSKEGFIDVTQPLNPIVAAEAKRVLNSTYEPKGIASQEGFTTQQRSLNAASQREGFTTQNDISTLITKMKGHGFKEGFINVAMNVAKNGLGIMPNSDAVEGYEDVKVEKNETPAPATSINKAVDALKGMSSEKVIPEVKDAMTMPFKLGEIPSQVKNGPHIDAGSTLMKAIKGLNPDQINEMTKDTQQLIQTQKSLMGMLGTMKPMLNDGKQLMETFQQMFG